MKENKKKIESLPFDEELDIFGEHKSREQVRKEEKQRRKDERQALKEEIARRRREAKEGNVPTRRKDVIVISAVLAGIVLLCVLALFNADRKDKKDKAWNVDESRGYYLDESAYPAMSGTQPEAALAEAYFTKNGHLCVKLIISNGTDKVMRINSFDAQGYEGYYDEVGAFQLGDQFAGGRIVPTEELTILVADTVTYTFYIAPEHLLVDESYQLPDNVSFVITFDHEPVVAE